MYFIFNILKSIYFWGYDMKDLIVCKKITKMVLFYLAALITLFNQSTYVFAASTSEGEAFPTKTVQVCVLLGYPGAGKGTMAQSLDTSVYKQLSFGDVLREELRKGTRLALTYKGEIEMSSVDKIRFLPEPIVRDLLDRYLTMLATSTNKVILDGYPKTIEQAIYLQEYFARKNMKGIIVFVDTDKSLLVERVRDRQTCSSCCKVYNKVSNPSKAVDKCDLCGHDLFTRGSDTAVNQQKRIEFFDETSSSLIEYYRSRGELLIVSNSGSLERAREEFHHILKTKGFLDE